MFKIIFIKNNRKGMTFPEVIVSIGIFSLIMIGVTQLLVKSWQNYNLAMNTNAASVSANAGMSKMIDVLRRLGSGDDGSYPIISANSFDFKFFSDIDKDGVNEKVHYYLSGTNLMVGVSDPSGFPLSYPSGDSSASILIKNVVNTGTQPLFYYYDGENNSLSSPVGSINQIRMTEVNLFIYRKEGNLNIDSYASLRNLSEHDTIE